MRLRRAAAPAQPPGRPTEARGRHRRSGACTDGQRQGLRRLPERRDRRPTSRSPAREGFRAVEHLKRYTTLGMATDQGKTSNVAGLAIMAEHDRPLDPADRHDDLPAALHAGRDRRARRPPSRHATSGRPGSPPTHRWVGRAGRGVRREPARGCARSTIRAPGEKDWLETVDARGPRRCATAVGVCDVSTLGKIDIQGADAGDVPRPRLHQRLLDAAGRQGALRPDAARGRLRHGRRHDRRGSAETHFLMTTTTAQRRHA